MTQPAPGRRGHVLLVEDHQVNQTLAVRILGKLGYSADVAVNGREAVEAVARWPYGAVLMDCQLPGMDGCQATEQIRRHEGTARRTPIIAMTAAALQGDRERCLAAGMDDYLTKPVSVADVERVLARWLPARAAVPPDLGPTGPVRQLVDPDRLAVLRALDSSGPNPAGVTSSLVRVLVDGFLVSAPADIARLRAAAGRDDATTMQEVVHHLKGAAMTLGLPGMAALCTEIEAMVHAGAFRSARDLVPHLETELDAARSALDAAASGG